MSTLTKEDFWDISAFLEGEEKIPVKFIDEAEGLGWLDRTGDSKTDGPLHAGTVADLPAWLAFELHRYDLVELEWPSLYGQQMRATLSAGAAVVSMQNSPYFYEIGRELATRMDSSEGRQLPATLIHAFAQRYRVILDKSQNWRDDDPSPFTKTLTASERELFECAYNASKDFELWKKKQHTRISHSDLLSTVMSSSELQQGYKRARPDS